MRPSNKSRSRNKSSNRNRNVGNVVNRVFDSAGPEGKVRGTPQQIIDKYQGLTRDAQLSGDRVAAENFQQHAEHYLRMLNEAMREQAERQAAEAAKRQQHQPQQRDGHPGEAARQGADEADNSSAADVAREGAPQPQVAVEPPADVIGAESASNLVETPEATVVERDEGSQRKPRSRTRRPAKKDAEAEATPIESGAPIQ